MGRDEKSGSWVDHELVFAYNGSVTHYCELLAVARALSSMLARQNGNAFSEPSRRNTCPRCGGHTVKHGFYNLKDGARLQRYLCRNCGRTCSPSTGTADANLKKRVEWARMATQMHEKLPLRQVAAQLGVHLSTAFRWRHRWLAARCSEPMPVLAGRVRVNKAIIRYSEKGSRTCRGPGSWGYWDSLRRGPRPAHYPPENPHFRRFIDGRPTFVLVAQNEAALITHLLGQGRPDLETLRRGFSQLVSADAEVYDFALRSIEEVCRQLNLHYRNGQQALREYFRTHRQERIELRRIPIRRPSCLYAWMAQFRGVATRYLHHYMTWFSLQGNQTSTA